jgi:hypothetical protein
MEVHLLDVVVLQQRRNKGEKGSTKPEYIAWMKKQYMVAVTSRVLEHGGPMLVDGGANHQEGKGDIPLVLEGRLEGGRVDHQRSPPRR